jgi:hypothetical protein
LLNVTDFHEFTMRENYGLGFEQRASRVAEVEAAAKGWEKTRKKRRWIGRSAGDAK